MNPPRGDDTDLVRGDAERFDVVFDEPYKLVLKRVPVGFLVERHHARILPVRAHRLDLGGEHIVMAEIAHDARRRPVIVRQVHFLERNSAPRPEVRRRDRIATQRAIDRLIGVSHYEGGCIAVRRLQDRSEDRILDLPRVLKLIDEHAFEDRPEQHADRGVLLDELVGVEEDQFEIDLPLGAKRPPIGLEDPLDRLMLGRLVAGQDIAARPEIISAVEAGDLGALHCAAQLLVHTFGVMGVDHPKPVLKRRVIDAVGLEDPLQAKRMDRADPQLARVDAKLFDPFVDLVRCPVRVGDRDNALLVRFELR